MSPFDSQGAQLLRQAVPTIEGAVVYVNDLQSAQIFEGMQRHSRIERELFISSNQAGAVVRGQAQAGDLGKGRVQVLQVGFQGDLGLVRLGNRVLGTEAE
jgi:hypothetical protein